MANKNIPYGHQHIDDDDISAVTKVLRSENLTQGPVTEAFENAITEYCGCKHAVSFCNGTAALHATCAVSELGPYDTGIVPAISFIASANCLEYVGASPSFADVQSNALPLISLETAKRALLASTRVIVPVHFAGSSAPMKDIRKFANDNELIVIEDAAHAIGAYYEIDGKRFKIGCCSHSDMTILSFHPVKNITTGEGGIVTTNSDLYADKLRQFRNHGINRKFSTTKPEWYYEMNSLGYNYRLSDIHAALGLSQLKKLDKFVAKRREIISRYSELLSSIDEVSFIMPNDLDLAAPHLAIMQCHEQIDRDSLFSFMRKNGIGTQLHYIPIYKHPYYAEKIIIKPGSFPNAEQYFNTALSLPLFPDLSTSDQNNVITVIKKGLKVSKK